MAPQQPRAEAQIAEEFGGERNHVSRLAGR